MFRFQHFSVEDDRSTMKVGTDAVLLACVVGDHTRHSTPLHPYTSTPNNLLDIGTGCGVIALMMAQLFPHATIDAMDIDQESVAQADANFRRSDWADRLHAHHCDIQRWEPGRRYDLIVSNPPYFSNSLRSPSDSRNRARHDDSLPTSELLAAVSRLLADDGTFWCILPSPAAEKLLSEAASSGLHCRQKVEVSSHEGGEPIRTIFELTRHVPSPSEPIRQHLREPDGTRSPWHKTISQEFYL